MGWSKDTPFNNPFAEAAGSLSRQVKGWRAEVARREQAAAERREREAEERRAREREVEERRAAEDPFRLAMQGVRPLDPRSRSRVAGEREEPRGAPARLDEDAEAYARLADLVEGNGQFDIEDTTEYVEGVASGVDRRLLRRLKQGDFSLQAHLDLHGLTRDEARPRVEAFITTSRTSRRRMVLLVHGRGLNSKDHVPVLKNALVSWLTRSRLAREVLAFCSARPVDGGAGALYVLLRK
jgi:DNA-nicking Smr family endonuclease